MKDKEDLKTNGRAVFYTVLYEGFRKAAIECGYTLSIHGSMASDMDLVAIPWVEDCKEPIDVVEAISKLIGGTIWHDHHFKNPKTQPHNRITYTLSIFSDYYIDLSIMIPIRK